MIGGTRGHHRGHEGEGEHGAELVRWRETVAPQPGRTAPSRHDPAETRLCFRASEKPGPPACKSPTTSRPPFVLGLNRARTKVPELPAVPRIGRVSGTTAARVVFGDQSRRRRNDRPDRPPRRRPHPQGQLLPAQGHRNRHAALRKSREHGTINTRNVAYISTVTTGLLFDERRQTATVFECGAGDGNRTRTFSLGS